jgi:signal transduction histidine kinase
LSTVHEALPDTSAVAPPLRAPEVNGRRLLRLGPGAGLAALVVTMLLVTIAGSFGAWLAAREMEWRMDAMVTENMPSVVAAAELQDALLQQRGLVASYMLDDGRLAWVNDLDKLKPELSRRLADAQRSARTEEERNILAQLAVVYAELDADRERAIVLYHDGKPREARDLLLGDVSRLSDQAHGLCRDLAAANQRFMAVSLERGRRKVASLAVLLPALVVLTTLLCLAVLLFVSRRLLRPVQRLVRDARKFSSERADASVAAFDDDVRELEFYSRAIMSDAARTRVHLEENQRLLSTAEGLAAVGRSAACAAHELRNPLSAMKLWLYQLRRNAHDPLVVEQCSIVLEEEASRLEELATNFLQYSKPPELRLSSQPLDEIVEGTLRLARHRLEEKRIRLVRDRVPNLPEVSADANQLRQVLLNLLSNAAEAAPEGGEVRISEAIETDAAGDPVVVLRVCDSGPGVPGSIREHLFEPFVTTKPRGTGLGLCVAANIVKRHGGRLELEPHRGPGAVFAIRLPAHMD